MLGIDVVLGLTVWIDLLRTPRPALFQVDRRLPERVGLSRRFEREVLVEAPAAAGLAAELDERFPAPFEVLTVTRDGVHEAPAADRPGAPDTVRFDSEGKARFVRAYRGNLRGLFSFESLRLRVTGPFGLWQRQARFEGGQELAVEPALLNLRQTLALAASDRWHDLGVRILRRRGGEREFESLREYVPGDDVRRVDWKAFARRGKPIVRQYQVERGQELILLVDLGRRMRATASGDDDAKRRGWTKLDWALDAAFQLAAVALAKGDRVGMAAFARGLVTFVAPARGSKQLARISSEHFRLLPREVDADPALALRELAVRHQRRATILILSDVADPLSVSDQRRALAATSRRHRIVFCALDDPGVRSWAHGEGEAQGRSGAALRAAALELEEDRRRALRELARSKVRVVDALPAEAAAPLLAAWLEERQASHG